MRPCRSLAAVCALALCALAAPSRAQDIAAAKTLFTQGLSEMEAEHYDKGCPALEASYKLDPRPGTLFTLAECENKRGRLATAVARYDDYLSMYARLTAEQKQKQRDREKTAREQKAALGPQVPELTLSLPPGAPPGTVVKRDGSELAAAALGLALPVDPGEHVVTTQTPDGKGTEIRVTLGKGEKKQVTLPVKDASAAPPVAAPPPPVIAPSPAPGAEAAHGPSGRRLGAYVAGGVGIAGIILGGVMGGLALGKKSEIAKNCNFPGDPKGCSDTGLAVVDSAKTSALVSTVGFGVGAAGVVAAGVLLLTEPKRAAGEARGVRAGVLSAGREGVTVGLQGAW
jgi:hypothetical protein